VFNGLSALKIRPEELTVESMLNSEFLDLPARSGSSIAALRRAVEQAGGQAVPLGELTVGALKESPYPLILHVAAVGQLPSYNHWLLLLGVDRGQAKIVDGQHEPELIPLASLASRWDGTALVVSDGPIDVSRVARRDVGPIFSIAVGASLCLLVFSRIGNLLSGSASRPGAIRRIPVDSVIVLATVATVAAGAHYLSDEGFFKNEAACTDIANECASPQWPELTFERLQEAMQDENVLVVDARFESSFRQGRLSGAVNMPVNASAEERQKLVENVPRTTPVVVYCHSYRTPFRNKIAAWFASEGFANLTVYPGGWQEWSNRETLFE
jgi:rhodanese-related sulfurtransferase